jgi:hypothetical protein
MGNPLFFCAAQNRLPNGLDPPKKARPGFAVGQWLCLTERPTAADYLPPHTIDGEQCVNFSNVIALLRLDVPPVAGLQRLALREAGMAESSWCGVNSGLRNG